MSIGREVKGLGVLFERIRLGRTSKTRVKKRPVEGRKGRSESWLRGIPVQALDASNGAVGVGRVDLALKTTMLGRESCARSARRGRRRPVWTRPWIGAGPASRSARSGTTSERIPGVSARYDKRVPVCDLSQKFKSFKRWIGSLSVSICTALIVPGCLIAIME